MPEWLKGTGCKPVGSAYVGSNPIAPIERRSTIHQPENEIAQLLAAGATKHQPVTNVGEGILVASVREPSGFLVGIIVNPNVRAAKPTFFGLPDAPRVRGWCRGRSRGVCDAFVCDSECASSDAALVPYGRPDMFYSHHNTQLRYHARINDMQRLRAENGLLGRFARSFRKR